MVKKLTAVRIKEKTLAAVESLRREDETVSETIRRALDDFVRRETKAKQYIEWDAPLHKQRHAPNDNSKRRPKMGEFGILHLIIPVVILAFIYAVVKVVKLALK